MGLILQRMVKVLMWGIWESDLYYFTLGIW